MLRGIYKHKIAIFCVLLFLINVIYYQVFVKNYYPIDFFVDNPNTIVTTLSWNFLSLEEKELVITEDLLKLLKENDGMNQNVKDILAKEYQAYFKDYLIYFKGKDYLHTLLATKYSKVNEEIFPDKEQYLVVLGSYDIRAKEITLNTYESTFHEKLHADRTWGFRGLKNEGLYEEVFVSFMSNDNSYDDLRGFFSLLQELLNDNTIEKSLFQKDYENIWRALKKEIPESSDIVNEIQAKIELVYALEYQNHPKTYNIWDLKQEILSLYEKLYVRKYQVNTSQDIIVGYLKSCFLGLNPFQNTNQLQYENFKIMENLEISKEQRQGNYENFLLNYIVENKNGSSKYQYLAWQKITNINDQEENKYLAFIKEFSKIYEEQEINDLFKEIIGVTATNYQYTINYNVQRKTWALLYEEPI